MIAIELRCPNNYSRLFAKVLVPGLALTIVEGNLVEFQCRECKRDLQPNWHSPLQAILHRYDIAGEFVETSILFGDGESLTITAAGTTTIDRADPKFVKPDQEA